MAPKRASGGARRKAKLIAQQVAAGLRAPDYAAATVKAHAVIGPGIHDLDLAVLRAREALEEAQQDEAMDPAQRREQVGRLAAILGKLADPKKLLEQMGAELREAYGVIESLRRSNAAQVTPGDPRRPQEGDPH